MKITQTSQGTARLGSCDGRPGQNWSGDHQLTIKRKIFNDAGRVIVAMNYLRSVLESSLICCSFGSIVGGSRRAAWQITTARIAAKIGSSPD